MASMFTNCLGRTPAPHMLLLGRRHGVVILAFAVNLAHNLVHEDLNSILACPHYGLLQASIAYDTVGALIPPKQLLIQKLRVKVGEERGPLDCPLKLRKVERLEGGHNKEEQEGEGGDNSACATKTSRDQVRPKREIMLTSRSVRSLVHRKPLPRGKRAWAICATDQILRNLKCAFNVCSLRQREQP